MASSTKPVISKITDSMGREITFTSSDEEYPKLLKITVKNATGADVDYTYTVDTFPNGFYKLTSFKKPVIPASSYQYDGSTYELKTVVTEYGGSIEYVYGDHVFNFSGTNLTSRVVTQKKITFNAGEEPRAWNFSYPSYAGATEGTTTVTGPEYSASFTHYGYSSSDPWRIGLIKSWSYGDGSSSEVYQWTYQQISNQTWSVLRVSMGTVKAPLLLSVETNRTGDASLKINYLYERVGTKRYGLPTRVDYYVNGSAVPRHYLELQYYYEARTSTWRDLYYMLDYIHSEVKRDGNGQMLAKTVTTYFDESGKRGAVDSISRYKNETTFYTWDYGYESSDPKEITISIKNPLGEDTTVKYKYGVRSDVTDGSGQLTRNISEYNSAVLSETNKYGGTVNYIYDGAGRINKIDRPDTPVMFYDTDYIWHDSERRLEIKQGGNTVNHYWDGTGRDLGSIQIGAELTLYYKKELDAEGRIMSENNGGISPEQKYTYQYDNSGRITRITNPLGKATQIQYAGRRKTIIDANNRATSYDYDDFPGQPTKVTDARGNQAFHTYDALGRLISVNHVGVSDGTRVHSYQYDWFGNIVSQSHPETGSISYVYDNAGRLTQEIWGNARKSYIYTNGRLTSIEVGKIGITEEIIDYAYDNEKGYLVSVSSSKGWSRRINSYNIWGAVTEETLSVQGLPGENKISYTYDSNNMLSSITYPSGRKAETTYNALNLPSYLKFNGKDIINNVTYHQQGLPASISICGNNTVYVATYSASGYLATESLKKGETTIYGATYSYDNVGNITSISSQHESYVLNASFSYDELYRLTSANYSTGRKTNYAYEYDDFGNMRRVFEDGIKVFEKSYDAQNRITGFTYDERGNLTNANGKFYLWDSLNRLQSIQNSSGELLGQYTYDDRGLRIKALPPLPEIQVKQGDINIADGDTVTYYVVDYEEKTFTVYNQGYLNLELGTITILGEQADQFQVTKQPDPVVNPGGSTTFKVKFQPTSPGLKIVELVLPNNDLDEGQFNIILKGNYAPEIDIMSYPNGSSYDFGTVSIGNFMRTSFRIRNLASPDRSPLYLTGTPRVEISGPDATVFSVEQQPADKIDPGQYSDFVVQFTPAGGEGQKEAYLSISNNDPDENPYIIYLYGTAGPVGPLKLDEDKDKVSVTSINGGYEILKNTFQVITWKPEDGTDFVRIEYSSDNGSTYKIIADRVPNSGRYDWLVPEELTKSCLFRITDADKPVPPAGSLLFEFNFKVPLAKKVFSASPEFSALISVPDVRRQAYLSFEINFSPYEAKKLIQVTGNNAWAMPWDYESFLGKWHNVRVEFDVDESVASFWLDGDLIFDQVGLSVEPVGSWLKTPGMITFKVKGEPGLVVWVDEIEARILDSETKNNARGAILGRFWQRLLADGFEDYENHEELKAYGGWAVKQALEGYGDIPVASIQPGQLALLLQVYDIYRTRKIRKDTRSLAVPDDVEFLSGRKSMRITVSNEGLTEAIKTLSLPEGIPFAISQNKFKIVESPGAFERVKERLRTRWEEAGVDGAIPGYRPSSAAAIDRLKSMDGSKAGSGGDLRTMSVGTVGIYYLYAFDGRLLAEYDGYGNCLREYIYIGAKMVAEYQPAAGKYYYYTTDQVNSTRVVTDDMGNVVYLAAHDPYGGVQQTWVNTFNPGWKFSGKEQDAESGLYYFGARYYDPAFYRFLSPDPQQIPAIARFEINRFNKYFFANNNPISYFEFSGLWAIIHKETKIINASYMSYLGKSIEGKDVYMKGFGMTNVLPEDLKIDLSKETGITVSVTFIIFILAREDIMWKQEDAIVGHNNYENVLRHELTHVYDILLMVSLALNKIEAQWKAGKISDEEARKLVNKAFIRASKASSSLRDDWGVEWFKWLINWFEELKPEHNYSAFWEWLLTPYIYFLMKCN